MKQSRIIFDKVSIFWKYYSKRLFHIPICTGNNLKLYAWEFLFGENVLNYAYVGNINRCLLIFCFLKEVHPLLIAKRRRRSWTKFKIRITINRHLILLKIFNHSNYLHPRLLCQYFTSKKLVLRNHLCITRDFPRFEAIKRSIIKS